MSLLPMGEGNPYLPTFYPSDNSGATHDFNPNTGLSREAYRDAWMGSGVSNINQMQDWLSKNGGTILSGNGTVQTPYGDILDMGTAFRTGNGTPGWTPVNSISGSQSNGSIMQNAGSGNLLQQLLAALGGNFAPNPNGQHLMNQQSAQPYNPYAGLKQGISSMFQPQSTNGTLLGTSVAPSNQTAPTTPNNFTATPQKDRYSWMPMGKTPMGAPSFYGNKSEGQTMTKPLPANNFS